MSGMAITLPRRRWRAAPSVAPGEIVYAIGDLHGRIDLFSRLIDAIGKDPAHDRGDRRSRIIVLGDVIDRGPDSRALLAALRKAEETIPGFEVLLGNHEAALLDSIAGNAAAQEMWLAFGGRETLRSFDVAAPHDDEPPAAFAARLADALGPAMLDWLEARPTFAASGDFFFCHAGIRPGVPLRSQGRDDLLWIREPFLGSTRHHGGIVVHGHTIYDAPCVRPNRIGIDTGAYRTGILTALRIEGTDIRVIQTEPDTH